MEGTTHQFCGICSGILVGTLFFPTLHDPMVWIHGGALLIGASVGSLMPDIDHPKSKMGRKAKIASKVVNKTCGHRGWTHTLLALVLIIGILFWLIHLVPVYQSLFGFWVIGFAIGYLSHLLLDALTVQGIPAFKPFSNKALRLTRFKTGGNVEGMTQGLFLIVTFCVVYYQYFR